MSEIVEREARGSHYWGINAAVLDINESETIEDLAAVEKMVARTWNENSPMGGYVRRYLSRRLSDLVEAGS